MSVCECLCASECLWLCALLLLLGLWALLLGLWFLWLWLGLAGACGRPCWASKRLCWAVGAFAGLSTCGRFCWPALAGLVGAFAGIVGLGAFAGLVGLWRPRAPTCAHMHSHQPVLSPFFLPPGRFSTHKCPSAHKRPHTRLCTTSPAKAPTSQKERPNPRSARKPGLAGLVRAFAGLVSAFGYGILLMGASGRPCWACGLSWACGRFCWACGRLRSCWWAVLLGLWA